MNREIEFRGISRKTNRFVYGMLMYSVSENGLVIVETVDCAPSMSDPCGDTINLYHPIIHRTESQLVMLLGDNKTKVFEGDVLYVKLDKSSSLNHIHPVTREYYHLVEYKKDGYYIPDIESIFRECLASAVMNQDKETPEWIVIGNIYENSHLKEKINLK